MPPQEQKTAWQNAWSKENAGNTAMGLVQGVTGIASAAGKNYQIKDTESLDEQIDALRNTEFGYGDFDSLQSAYNPATIHKVTGDDLRSSDGERFSNTLSAITSGASAGMAFGPIGAAVGAGVGLLGSIGGMWAGNIKAGKEAVRLNKEAEAAQKEYLANFANNAHNISQSNFNRAALNLAAFGGMLKDNNINSFLRSRVRLAAFGGDMMSPMGRTDGFTNGVTKVDEGGSHETNPFDGVMMGVDPQGVPNLVEEGEVVFNDYVFSNRLSPTEEELESVKLPRKYAKKPYSKIAWDIQRESRENPLDKISRNTLVDSMMKLTTLQEQSRERDREYEAFSNLESVFADGGDIHIAPSKRGTFTAAAKRHGMGVQEFASKVLANKDKYSPAMVKKANFAHVFGGRHYDNGGFSYNINNVAPNVPQAPNVNIAAVPKINDTGFPKINEQTILAPQQSSNLISNSLASTRSLQAAQELNTQAELAKLRMNNAVDAIGANNLNNIGRFDIYALGGPMGNMFEGPGDVPNWMNNWNSTYNNFGVGLVPDAVKAAAAKRDAEAIAAATNRPPVATTQATVPVQPSTQRTQSPTTVKTSPVKKVPALSNVVIPEVNVNLEDNFDDKIFDTSADEKEIDAILKSDLNRASDQAYWSNVPEFKTSWANTTMRAVPVIGSSINALGDAFGWRNNEDYSALDLIKQRENQIRNVRTSPIGRYMAFNPYDVDYEMNRLQNVGLGTQRALLDSAGGNPLAARNAALALNANLTSQMGAARRGGAQYNDDLRRAVTQFNSGIDQFNANQTLQAGVYNQRGDVERMEGAIRRAALMDAIQTATSQARSTEETAALNNWGQWGNDRVFAEMVAAYPELMGLSNGTITRLLGTYTQAKGGKLNRVKEFKKK